MRDRTILAVVAIDIIATIYSCFNPSLAAKIDSIYIASVGGLWMKHQMEQTTGDDEHDK